MKKAKIFPVISTDLVYHIEKNSYTQREKKKQKKNKKRKKKEWGFLGTLASFLLVLTMEVKRPLCKLKINFIFFWF